jgi:hypothetical protein
MGSLYHFRCQRCDYHAEVSGGQDVGFYVRTRTVYCPACRELRDINVEYWCKDLMTPSDLAELKDDQLGRCLKCGGREVVDWSAGDPCPRCSGAVINQGLAADWD